ncbi:trypsin-1-like isoform X2 [Adelges cooleyi]|uniref:trypsin-1-like isoform X2 n=1 Tax=Adelges cooleyi TaxID=133065 RepID=UPI0021805417|nr:trypsin-1-like isoform X2 [Adelges cooleyi]
MMWKILFFIVVPVSLIKPLPQSPIHTNLNTNLLNKIGMMGDKVIFEINNIRNKLLALMLDRSSKPPTISDLHACPVCKCGTEGKKGKIVGGTQVQYAHKYPWMASIAAIGYEAYGRLCGAALINDRYVVTAAHCIKPMLLPLMEVRLYEHDLENNVDNVYRFKVRQLIMHENYDIRKHDSDIALLRLDIDGGVPMSENLHPVCMPKEGLTYEHRLGVATGWGKLKKGGKKPMVLREVTVPILDHASCAATSSMVTENMFCAGLPEGGKDTCQGDSGGPLTVTNGSVHRLVGVTSWGDGCAVPKKPGLYVKVNNYLDWIKENTLDACWCDDI